MDQEQVKELLLQSLEHEKCGVDLYETALQCVRNDDLRQEFQKYHQQTRSHVRILTDLCLRMDIDPGAMTPGREVVRRIGHSLVEAMRRAGMAASPEAAEIVACECVVLAETKDHLNWELIGQVARAAEGERKQALMDAYEEVEDQEDEHLYHARGWARELRIQALGLEAVLPPPEERRHVKTAVAAARAQRSAGR